jgi:F-type H+-transporting ATPase subunit epsilon
MALKLLVVTLEKKVAEAEADEVELPGELGYLGILPGHAPLITLLKTGVLTYRRGGSAQALALASGFAEIAADTVTVLADRAEAPREIDAAAAERERQKAEEEMKTASIETLPAIRERLQMAEARLAVARGRAS